MRKAILIRYSMTPTETLGILVFGGEYVHTLERPWLDNARNTSCIPAGEYNAIYVDRTPSGRFKRVYRLLKVPNRSGILIHNGNIVDHTQGCILLGKRTGMLYGKKAVLNSKAAMRQFNDWAEKEPIVVRVVQ